jgi:signal transduction histidine kinase/HAMP domain-containing protein/ActR/RegA family two-component response regulator
MIKKGFRKFSTVRMQLVASVFVAIAPALVLTYLVNQAWFWEFAPDWLKQYALDVPWASFVVGLLALAAAWFGGEHFILQKVRAVSAAAQRFARGDLNARTELEATEDEFGQLAKIFDNMAESLQQRINEREMTEKILLDRAAQQTAVAALGQFALNNNDLDALLNQAALLAAQTLDAEYAGVWKRLPDGELLLQAGTGWHHGDVGNARLPANSSTQIGFTLQSGEPMLEPDPKTKHRFAASQYLDGHGIMSSVTVEISTRGPAFGVLGVHTTRHRKFTMDEAQFLIAVAACIGMAADRLNLETQLLQSQKMESIGQLAAGVAHDFNNMLTIIQGNASLLLAKQSLPPEIADRIQAVFFASERAANLTRQLLMFSRKNVMQLNQLDLRETVGNMTKMLGRLLGETVSLNFQSPAELPRVMGDVGMIEQVVMNLAVNARDAMPRGGTLDISLEAVTIDAAYAETHPDARPGHFLRLRVSDTGIGMDAPTLSRIFEPFFTTKEIGKGTGLGLATVYGVVKQHDGWIEVQSEPGRGATFSVFLPASGQPAASEQKEIAAPAPAGGGTETIFVVEDEDILRGMAGDILKENGYRVLDAASGRQALEVWRNSSREIDLLLTDMVMPEGISGVDLAERLMSDRPDLKVVYTSGYSAGEINAELLTRSQTYFLQKPYTQATLTKIIRDALDRNGVKH